MIPTWRTRKSHKILPTKPRDTVMTIRVSRPEVSSFDPKSLNMFSKPGMTNVKRTVNTPKNTKMTMLG